MSRLLKINESFSTLLLHDESPHRQKIVTLPGTRFSLSVAQRSSDFLLVNRTGTLRTNPTTVALLVNVRGS